MKYWLLKSEPSDFSIDDALAAPNQTEPWNGIRNYQARNFIRDQMSVGDNVLFYHSSCPQPGIAGLAEIVSHAYPDPSQFDAKSGYFDAGSKEQDPRWLMRDVKAHSKCALISLASLREHEALAQMIVLKRGNRLSICPVTAAEWRYINKKLVSPVSE